MCRAVKRVFAGCHRLASAVISPMRSTGYLGYCPNWCHRLAGLLLSYEVREVFAETSQMCTKTPYMCPVFRACLL